MTDVTRDYGDKIVCWGDVVEGWTSSLDRKRIAFNPKGWPRDYLEALMRDVRRGALPVWTVTSPVNHIFKHHDLASDGLVLPADMYFRARDLFALAQRVDDARLYDMAMNGAEIIVLPVSKAETLAPALDRVLDHGIGSQMVCSNTDPDDPDPANKLVSMIEFEQTLEATEGWTRRDRKLQEFLHRLNAGTAGFDLPIYGFQAAMPFTARLKGVACMAGTRWRCGPMAATFMRAGDIVALAEHDGLGGRPSLLSRLFNRDRMGALRASLAESPDHRWMLKHGVALISRRAPDCLRKPAAKGPRP